MNNQDIVYTEHTHVKCDGQGEEFDGALGHPLVYLEIKDQQITCPYCSRIFKLKR